MDDQTKPTPGKSTAGYDPESLSAVEGLVQRLSVQSDELKAKQQELSAMLKGIFEQDSELQQAQTIAKEAGQSLKNRQGELNDTQEVKDLKLKLADLREDLKLIDESLDVHLLNYYQMTNSTSFPTPDGSEREFILKAKLKPKKKS